MPRTLPSHLADGGDPVPGERVLFGALAFVLLLYVARVVTRATAARRKLARTLANLGGDD